MTDFCLQIEAYLKEIQSIKKVNKCDGHIWSAFESENNTKTDA